LRGIRNYTSKRQKNQYILKKINGKPVIGFSARVMLMFPVERNDYMTIMRVNKTNNFTVMSNFHFKEKKMSLKAKGLLSLMLSLPDSWDYSISGLTTLSKDGKDSVMSALAELEKFGYLTRERIINEKGQFAGVEYNIYEEPQPKKPVTEKQNEEKQNEDKPNSANREQLNTNSINNLFNQVFEILNTNDAELISLYHEYIKVRDNMKAPLTEISLEMLIERAKRLSKSNVKIEKLLLETAIINGWKNVYLPREEELESVREETRSELKAMFGLE
jgi:hypothetical protein